MFHWNNHFLFFHFFPYIGNHIPNWLIIFMNPVMVTSRKMFHWNCPIFRISQHVSALATRLVGVFGHAHAFPQCAGPLVIFIFYGVGMGLVSRDHIFSMFFVEFVAWKCGKSTFLFLWHGIPNFSNIPLRGQGMTFSGWCVCLASTNRILDLSRFLIPYCLDSWSHIVWKHRFWICLDARPVWKHWGNGRASLGVCIVSIKCVPFFILSHFTLTCKNRCYSRFIM